ncbi:long-chain-fatty-acid--CoA ligase [Dictyobacter vulcani]|uniref:Long-chain-fatty-acid--CoA ligase n=1 Tax=Dictyobacter vulcani TaxID=2607529 RepID=A0A5J4KMA5_9CHLR|nr:long-chain fatty acid--CoA ligase [Dictyobacter vulcani]GER88272.1 long-chain-fatty-acid--CoA ligase [Dictyobacter vulcani]
MSDPSLIPNTQTEQYSDEQTYATASYPWLQNYDQGVPTHLNIPERPLTSLLDTTAKKYPNQAAFVYYGNRITYAQFSHQANRFAIELQRLGVQKGDRVAIALPNIPQFPIAFYGALRTGAVVVPTNPLYTEREMQHQLADSGAKVLVVLDMYYPIIRNIRNQTALEHVIVTNPADFLPPHLQLLFPLSQQRAHLPQPPLTKKELEEDATLHSMQPVLKSRARTGIELFNLPVQIESNDLAVLQYTGGTTGLSKGAMLTHRNLLANAMQTRYWVPKAKEGKEISLCVAPFFHAYGLSVGMNLSILAASTMVLLPQFKPKDVLNAIHQYHPTMFPGIPTMYLAIMKEAAKHPEYLESIKYCISGASALPAKVQSDFETITKGHLVEGYGLSEASPVTHCNPLTDKSRNGSIGLPLPEVESAILDQTTGEPLPMGEVGEIVVKGPNIMQGYWQRDEETQNIFVHGWMRTGDIGKMDADGYFYVVERAKDMIIASGFNVYPREIEEVLFHHPAIAEAAVTGVPDAYRGETVAAFIVLKEGFKASETLEKEIVAFCRERLAAYKVPKKLVFRADLPKTLVGKVLRRELRKLL